jgi:hypothetical protein
MSIKDLFEKGEDKILKASNVKNLKEEIESLALIEEDSKRKRTFIPPVDFTTASNFAKFGSAESYYQDSIKRIYKTYPYDGSKKEKVKWENESSYLDRFIFENLYPRTTGYINIGQDLSPVASGISDTYYVYNTNKPEYVFFKGGPNADPQGDYKQALDIGSSSLGISKANIWDHDVNRTSNLRFNPASGSTVEFWMKKNSWAGDHANISSNANVAEIIFDLWNSGSATTEISSGGKYGRYAIYLDKATPTKIKINQRSGSVAHDTDLETNLSTIADSKWHHYTIVTRATGSTNLHRLYVDGVFASEHKPGAATVFGEYTGPLMATLGAQINIFAGDSTGGRGYGKLSASLDEFRYWKTARDSKDHGRHWFTQVNGGTNTDNDKYNSTGSVDLGVYYKFNEGISENDSVDGIVLDYAGRISNGTWIGYTGSYGSRNIGSAINENMIAVTASISEFKDPIIYSDHPQVTSLLTNMKASGSSWDLNNNASIFNSLPGWITEQDLSDERNDLKNLTQVIASYFDKMFLQIEHLPRLGDKRYFTGSIEKPHPFSDVRMQSHGFPSFLGPELFEDADLLEKIMQRGEKKKFELSLFDIKNRIYQNIYNNMTFIYKSKGTEKSLRNLLRCYGVDDEIIKINLYAGNETYEIKDTYKSTTVRKKYVDFNDSNLRYQTEGVSNNSYSAIVYQYPESGNPNSVSYISGAIDDLELSGTAVTFESEVIFPKILSSRITGTVDLGGDSISLFGMHTPNTTGGTGSTDTTWASADVACMRVVAHLDPQNINNYHFEIDPGSDGALPITLSPKITGSSKLYDNNKWNFAVRVRPENYPYINFVSGSNTKNHSIEDGSYFLEFYGINTYGDVVLNEFLVSSSMTTAVARQFLNAPKRIYAGADRTNFSGTLVLGSNVKVGSVRYWLDYLPNEAIYAHARDATNYGAYRASKNAFFAQNSGSTDTPRNTMMHTEIPQIETLALHWSFETVTGSDAAGQFVVADASSGSMALAHDFDLYGAGIQGFSNILKKQHTGRGDKFSPNTFKTVDKDWIYTAKQHLPEILNSSDGVKILTQDDDLFVRDTDLTNFFFGIEKSMYQTISEEMLKMFATIKDFHNLIGDPVNKYRQNYKTLEKVKELFFMKMENTPDLDRYVDFYIWIDSAVTKMIDNLVPASANVSKLRTMVESHILERNKYVNKFPTVDTKIKDPEGKLRGIRELKYNWKDGHAPFQFNSNNLGFLFDASANQYISAGDHASLSFGDSSADSPFSFSLWAYITDISATRGLIGKSNEYFVFIDTSQNMHVRLMDNAGSQYINRQFTLGAGVLPTFMWHNIIVTYDGSGAVGGIKAYLNGQQLATVTDTSAGSYTAMHDTGNGFHIGRASTAYFNGVMDDIMVFDQEIQLPKVKQIFFNIPEYGDDQGGGFAPRPIHWWRREGAADATNIANAGISQTPTAVLQNGDVSNMTTFGRFGFGFDNQKSIQSQRDQCLWWKERVDRGRWSPGTTFTDVDDSRVAIHQALTTDTFTPSGSYPVLSSSFTAEYTGSTYAIRRLSIPYIYTVGESLQIKGGPNLQKNHKYDYAFSSVSKLTGSSYILANNRISISASSIVTSSKCLDVEIFDGVSGSHLHGEISNKPIERQHLEPFRKKKIYFEADHVQSKANPNSSDGFNESYGHKIANFNIYSSSHALSNTGQEAKDYSAALIDIRLNNATITDLHHDVYGPDYEKPMQGPFTERWVGGKRNEIFTNEMHTFKGHSDDRAAYDPVYLDNLGDRVESFTLQIHGNEINVHPGNYLDPHNLQKTWIHKETLAKRPVNIRNIPTINDPHLSATMESGEILLRALLGNFSKDKNYQVVNTPGRSVNNLWLRSGSKGHAGENFGGLSYTLVRPQGDLDLGCILSAGSVLSTAETTFQVPGHINDAGEALEAPIAARPGPANGGWGYLSGAIDYELPQREILSGSPDNTYDSFVQKNRTIIAEKFSAPGGFEVMSRGYLDPAHEAYSVYNAIPYRNMSVRLGMQSGINISSSAPGGKFLRKALTGSKFTHELVHGTGSTDLLVSNINLPHDISGAAYAGTTSSLLVRHCGQFGLNSRYVGSIMPDESVHENFEFRRSHDIVHNRPSFHKIHRNNIENYAPYKIEFLENSSYGALDPIYATNGVAQNSYFVAADHDNLSFGDASNDSAFTLSCWWYVLDMSSHVFMSKCSGSSNLEYIFGAISGGDRMDFMLFDNSVLNYIGQRADSAQTSLQASWNHYAVTYDGSSNASGIKIYVNGEQLATSAVSNGSYTAMHNTAADFMIGKEKGITTPDLARSTGYVDECSVWNKALSATEINELYKVQNLITDFGTIGDIGGVDAGYRGSNGVCAPGDLNKHPAAGNLVAWWRFGDHENDSFTPNTPSGTIADATGNSHTLHGRLRATVLTGTLKYNLDYGPLTINSSHNPLGFQGRNASSLGITTESDKDNPYVTHNIPRLDNQYSWITASLKV